MHMLWAFDFALRFMKRLTNQIVKQERDDSAPSDPLASRRIFFALIAHDDDLHEVLS